MADALPAPAPDWGSLPSDCIALIVHSLLQELHKAGPTSLRQAARALAALSPNAHWRAVAVREARFAVRLASWDPARLGCVAIRELTLPPLAPADAAAGGSSVLTRTGLLLGNSAFRRRSGASLAALHNLPVQAAAAGQLAGWRALRALSLAPGSLPEGGGATPADFLPGTFPPQLQRLDLPTPRHPFRPAGGLPPALGALTLRCRQDFIVDCQQLLGLAAAEPSPAAVAGAAAAATAAAAAAAPAAPPPASQAAAAAAAPSAASRHWRHVTVHAGRTAGLDLDSLACLGGAVHSLTLVAPLVMLSTSDPSHPPLLAAPPVRRLEGAAGAYLAVLAPVLAAAGVARLRLVAGESSFYCRQPGRRAILDAGALPPAGRAAAPQAVCGYAARLEWPAAGGELACPAFCLMVERE